MIDYSNLKQGYENSCSQCGYSEMKMNYSSRKAIGSHMGNYSGSNSNSYDVEAKQ